VHPSSSSNTDSTPARTGTPQDNVSRSSSRRGPSAGVCSDIIESERIFTPEDRPGHRIRG
jgi:hypothetical protein